MALLNSPPISKTITASFATPDNGQPVRINLTDTSEIVVGAALRIGLDYYLITNVDPLGVSAVKTTTIIPVGTECSIISIMGTSPLAGPLQ